MQALAFFAQSAAVLVPRCAVGRQRRGHARNRDARSGCAPPGIGTYTRRVRRCGCSGRCSSVSTRPSTRAASRSLPLTPTRPAHRAHSRVGDRYRPARGGHRHARSRRRLRAGRRRACCSSCSRSLVGFAIGLQRVARGCDVLAPRPAVARVAATSPWSLAGLVGAALWSTTQLAGRVSDIPRRPRARRRCAGRRRAVGQAFVDAANGRAVASTRRSRSRARLHRTVRVGVGRRRQSVARGLGPVVVTVACGGGRPDGDMGRDARRRRRRARSFAISRGRRRGAPRDSSRSLGHGAGADQRRAARCAAARRGVVSSPLAALFALSMVNNQLGYDGVVVVARGGRGWAAARATSSAARSGGCRRSCCRASPPRSCSRCAAGVG